MANPLVDNALKLLEFARRNTLAFLEDIPEDKWCHQPFSGANTITWVLGHLAHTDNFFTMQFAGAADKIPAGWNELFGMGSKPTGERSKYPAPAELRDVLCARREELLAWVRAIPEKKLMEPLSGDWLQFAPNTIGLAGSIAWHEGLHAGQLTAIRKSLGIGPKYG